MGASGRRQRVLPLVLNPHRSHAHGSRRSQVFGHIFKKYRLFRRDPCRPHELIVGRHLRLRDEVCRGHIEHHIEMMADAQPVHNLCRVLDRGIGEYNFAPG